MKFLLIVLAVLLLAPGFLLAEATAVPEVPSREKAAATISSELFDRQKQEADRITAIEKVPALEVWELDHGNRKTILRRVAPPAPQLTVHQALWL